VKIHKRGKTVIVVTHEANLVNYFQQRVIRIKEGKVISDGVGGMDAVGMGTPTTQMHAGMSQTGSIPVQHVASGQTGLNPRVRL